MNPIIKNILAVFAGVLVGGVVNMSIIMLSSSIIPVPEGVDPSDAESIKASIHLYGPQHFIFPFLAHAIGTLAGAYTTARIAASHQMKLAIGIGGFFLIGGIMTVQMISAPIWFAALDLIGAYLPMGWLGGRLAGHSSGRAS